MLWRRDRLQYSWTSLVAQLVRNLPAMWETWVRSLGWEDPLEKGTSTHSTILAWRIPLSLHYCIVVVQSLSRVWLLATPSTAAHQAPLSFTVSQSLLKFMSIESVMLSNHLIICRPLLLPLIFPSIRVFSNESVLHIRWPKDYTFSCSVRPSNEYSGLISFEIAFFDLLAVLRTFRSLL